MPNKCLEKYYSLIYQCIARACQICRAKRLIVIARRYADLTRSLASLPGHTTCWAFPAMQPWSFPSYHAGRSALRSEGLQLGRYSVQGVDHLQGSHGLRSLLPRTLCGWWLQRSLPGLSRYRHSLHRDLLHRCSLPLCDGGCGAFISGGQR
jgi:hypothetical protein